MVLPRTRTSSVPLQQKLYSAAIFISSMSAWFGAVVSEERRTIASFVEAVGRITMRGENSYFMPAILEADGCVDNETFCSTYAEVWMEENDVLGLGAPIVFIHCSRCRLVNVRCHVVL
jgi:hypothetical protein